MKEFLSQMPELVTGLGTPYRGKVWDTYDLSDRMLFKVATDRISIFDFLLNAELKGKGYVLAAMNIFWRRLFDSHRHDLIAYGSGIDKYLRMRAPHLCGNPDLQKRGLIVHKCDMCDFEGIVRGYVTGSGLTAYQETGKICGHVLPPGLHDGSKLSKSIFTPSTKEKIGHDVHISAASVREKYGMGPEDLCLKLYDDAAEYAETRGIIIADTKFEVGMMPYLGLSVADEMLTPDTSRYWDADEYAKAQLEKKSPPSYDKQIVRNWGKKLGIDKLEPKDPEHRKRVFETKVDPDVLALAGARYAEIFKRLSTMPLEDFHYTMMGIR